MSSDPQVRPRRSFGDLAKLANSPAFNPQADGDEGSGLIHLATLEAAERERSALPAFPETAKAEVVLAVPSTKPRPAIARVGMLGLLLVGALVGSLAATAIRSAAAPIHPIAPAPSVSSATAHTRAPNEESEKERLTLPPTVPVMEAPATSVAAAPPQTVSRPSGREQPRFQDPQSHAPPNAAGRGVQPTQGDRATSPPEEAATSTPSRHSLADQIEEAAQAEGQSPKPSSDERAPTNPDGVAPRFPTIGAINSAMRTALWAAQACVDGDDPISHAMVRFNSAGTVEAVTVTGWAAGKPVEACIKDALKKPRVAPFVQSSYTVPVTIRSN